MYVCMFSTLTERKALTKQIGMSGLQPFTVHFRRAQGDFQWKRSGSPFSLAATRRPKITSCMATSQPSLTIFSLLLCFGLNGTYKTNHFPTRLLQKLEFQGNPDLAGICVLRKLEPQQAYNFHTTGRRVKKLIRLSLDIQG